MSTFKLQARPRPTARALAATACGVLLAFMVIAALEALDDLAGAVHLMA